MARNNKPQAAASLLETAKAKQATLDELYARLAPDADGHRPLTVEEQKIQKDNALTVDELRALQADLYGHWVAVDNIYIDGALAFAPGHAVPTTHVDKFDLQAQGLVVPSAADAAAAADPAAANG